jgi:hypothetical protein
VAFRVSFSTRGCFYFLKHGAHTLTKPSKKETARIPKCNALLKIFDQRSQIEQSKQMEIFKRQPFNLRDQGDVKMFQGSS